MQRLLTVVLMLALALSSVMGATKKKRRSTKSKRTAHSRSHNASTSRGCAEPATQHAIAKGTPPKRLPTKAVAHETAKHDAHAAPAKKVDAHAKADAHAAPAKDAHAPAKDAHAKADAHAAPAKDAHAAPAKDAHAKADAHAAPAKDAHGAAAKPADAHGAPAKKTDAPAKKDDGHGKQVASAAKH